MPPSTSAPTPAARARATAAEATSLYEALATVVQTLRRAPLPVSEDMKASLQGGTPPPPRHLAALLHIAAEGPIGMSDLADRLRVSLATASLVVTGLGDRGLVERHVDTADRRRTLVSVAPAHRPMVTSLLDCRLKPLQRALRRLDPEERAALIRGLTVVAEELDHPDDDSKAYLR